MCNIVIYSVQTLVVCLFSVALVVRAATEAERQFETLNYYRAII
jgi:hypothetical protein